MQRRTRTRVISGAVSRFSGSVGRAFSSGAVGRALRRAGGSASNS